VRATARYRMGRAAIVLTVLTLLLFMQDVAVHPGNGFTLKGEYLWENMHHTGNLEAAFIETGDREWDVEFRFVWEGDLHVYRGTAEGSLVKGELHGKVVTDNPEWPRTFFFAGRFNDGRFTGIHTALQASGGAYPTGTLTLVN